MKVFAAHPQRAALLSVILTVCGFSEFSRASVTFEFQLGAVPIPSNSLGVIVADTGGDGFESPQQAVGTVLAPGSSVGASNDRIISVFPITSGDPFTAGSGFAEFVGPIDYDALGLAEGQALVFYAFPGRAEGNAIRAGETFLTYRTDQPEEIIGNMDFSLPEDGGSYVLGVLDQTLGGAVDLTASLPSTSLIAVADSPDLIVGKSVSLQLEGTGNPSRFIAQGLPPGLRLDPRTGLISGRLSRAGSFQLKIRVRNGSGTSGPLIVEMNVAELPDQIIGNFEGLVARESTVNEALGGKLTLKTAQNGRLTGRLVIGRRSYGFRGELDAAIASGVPLNPTASVTINRRRATPISVDLAFDLDTETFEGIIGADEETTQVDGIHQTWHPRTHRPEGYEGYYTTWMDLDPLQSLEGEISIPQGNGFSGLTVLRSGNARWMGKMADGSPLTSAGILGPNGEYLLFRTLYRNTGSVIGSGAIMSDPGNDGDFSDNTVDGQWNWLKHPQSSPRQRNYRDGFGVDDPVNQLVGGGRYFPPSRGEILLGLPEDTGNAQLSFTEGGLNETASNPDLIFTANASGRGLVPKPGSPENPARTVFSVNRRTGWFRGGFLLQDVDPDSGKLIRRPVVYLGILRSDLQMGTGYFLVNQLANPTADPPVTLRNSPILSGQVLLEAAD